MNTRLGTHLVKRLRHRLEAEALARAVDADILIAGTWDVDGVQVRGFTAHPLMLQRTPRQIERLVARLGSRDTTSRSTAMALLDFEDDTYVVAKDSVHLNNGTSAKRGTSKAPTPRRGCDARYRRLTASLLRGVRCSADCPQAAEIATLLLVARAVAENGVPLAEVLRILRTPRPIIALVATVAGFEGCFTDLLVRGMVLPGRVAIASGYELSSASVRFGHHDRKRWRIITFPGIKFDPDETDDTDKRVGRAALIPYPILGVAESEERLPQRLRSAAQITLSTGPLGIELVKEVIAAVLGEEPQGSLPDESCSLLTMSDLAIAIRPGITAAQALDVLGQIAATKRVDLQAGKGKPGSRDSCAESASRNRTSKYSRGDPGSGSEIIQPVPLTGDDSDRFIARVETLTGYGAAAEWAMSLKADLDLWRAGELDWREMSTRLLLSGPPGTGKTSFAKALCNSLQIPLVVSSVSTWLEPGYLGDVLKRMSAAFAEAESLKPAILFIDELDGIGTRRQQGEWADYGNNVINRGLELLDGATRSSGVIVVAATNHVAMIDPAMLRSGRLERHIEIPPPDTDALVGILRHHLKEDLDDVIASAPVQVTQAVVARQTAIADAAGHGGTSESDPVEPERSAEKDGPGEPPEATDGLGCPATASIRRTEVLEAVNASGASHGEV